MGRWDITAPKQRMKKLWITLAACLLMVGNATAAYVNETIAEKTLINGLYYRLTHSAWPEMGIADTYDAIVLPKAEQSSNSNYVSGSITIPGQVNYGGHSFTVSTISDNAFYQCTNLTSITVNSSLIAIGKYAFYGCSSLQDVTIKSSDISFNGEYIFSACGALKNVTFTQYNSVSNFYVADNATAIFYGCSNLKSIVLPAACEKVTNYFFGNCSSLEYVFFGAVGTTSSLLNSMEANVFYQCGNVRGIYINKNGAAPSIQSTTFSGIPSSAHVYVPCNYVSNYNSGYWSSVSVAGNFPYAFEVLNSDAAKGSITVTKEPDCDNTSAQIAAYPYAGYAFEAWYDVDNNVVYSYQPQTTIANVNRDMHLSAQWVKSDCSTNGVFPYQLNLSANMPQAGTTQILKAPDCDDASAQIAAYPYAGYAFEAWYDMDNNVVYSYQPQTTIANVNRDMHLSAQWVKSDCSTNGVFPYQLNLSANMPQAGTTQIFKAPDCDDASARIAAYPYAGYAFEAWYDVDNNLVYSYEPITSIANVNRNMNLQAYFVEADCSTNGTFPYRLDVESANAQQGAVAIYKIPSCDDSSARISASGFAGYTFEAWVDVDNGNVVYSYEPVTNIADVNRDMHLVAHFIEASCESNGTFPFSFNAFSDNSEYGSVEVRIPTCDDKSARAYARPNTGYEFVIWSDGTTENPRNWSEVNQNVNICALFKEKDHGCQIDGVLGYMFKIEPNDYNMGTTMMTRIPDCSDPSTQIAAIAKEGYEFVRWSDGDKNAMRTVTVSGDIYLQALFQDPANPVSGIEEVMTRNSDTDTQKLIIDGALYILYDGRLFDARGARVK